MKLDALGAVGNKIRTFKPVAEKDITRIVEPAGLHFKSNPIKAFLNANFYEPKPIKSDEYVKIIELNPVFQNDRLKDATVPFKSVLANYAKSINKELSLSFITHDIITHDNLGYESVSAHYEPHILQKPIKTSQFGTKQNFYDSPPEEKKAVHDLFDAISEIVPSKKPDQFYLTTKKVDIDAKPIVLKK